MRFRTSLTASATFWPTRPPLPTVFMGPEGRRAAGTTAWERDPAFGESRRRPGHVFDGSDPVVQGDSGRRRSRDWPEGRSYRQLHRLRRLAEPRLQRTVGDQIGNAALQKLGLSICAEQHIASLAAVELRKIEATPSQSRCDGTKTEEHQCLEIWKTFRKSARTTSTR